MQASELRIGNFVNRIFDSPKSSRDFEVITISAIDSNYNTVIDSDNAISGLDELEPIPLNKHLFEDRIGIREVWRDAIWELSGEPTPFEIAFNKDQTASIRVLLADYGESGEGAELIHIKYLHQFQNLYFMIQGKELEIKPA